MNFEISSTNVIIAQYIKEHVKEEVCGFELISETC